jgi:uncharacterized membrane protein
MAERPVFIYAATYPNLAAEEADYAALLDLHAADLVGTYDVAAIHKDENGKVHVKKHEKPTQHGAWGGIAVGALVGVLFPPSIIASAAVGGAIGGIGGHLKDGLSRADAKEFGETLETGEAALIVIGESRIGEQLSKTLTRAGKTIEKEVDADSKEFHKELEAAEIEVEKQATAVS